MKGKLNHLTSFFGIGLHLWVKTLLGLAQQAEVVPSFPARGQEVICGWETLRGYRFISFDFKSSLKRLT